MHWQQPFLKLREIKKKESEIARDLGRTNPEQNGEAQGLREPRAAHLTQI